jgi:hypothetical protein
MRTLWHTCKPGRNFEKFLFLSQNKLNRKKTGKPDADTVNLISYSFHLLCMVLAKMVGS